MDYDELSLRELPQSLARYRSQTADFLRGFSLKREPMDRYVGLFSGERMVAGGGSSGATIKCIAVAEDYQGLGLTGRIISHLSAALRADGLQNYFVFTKPENELQFCELGFSPIGKTREALLLEYQKGACARFAQALEPFRGEGLQGAVVMNANPFTLGHQYLVERAARQCQRLHVFVVREERSAFPFEVRFSLVKQGLAHLSNVLVHSGGDYIISGSTFPSYFLKEDSDIASVHAALDADIFGRCIAPALNITRRFVGEEPKDPMTARYNQAMREQLPPYGIKLSVISRREAAGEVISASRVRTLLASGEKTGLLPLVPHSTAAFLQSEAAAPIVQALQAGKRA